MGVSINPNITFDILDAGIIFGELLAARMMATIILEFALGLLQIARVAPQIRATIPAVVLLRPVPIIARPARSRDC